MNSPQRKLRIAIIGGGIAGVTAAWEIAHSEVPVEATLFESSTRLGGIVETVREQCFVIECGPDSWVTEKPWAKLLVQELGLSNELLPSNDSIRKTYILRGRSLIPMPDGMRMMVPGDLDALTGSPLFSESARQAFHSEITRAEELKGASPASDESVASFVRRHFGDEVLDTVASPLLSGVFGGNVEELSVRAVMGPFVAMEREHGSLIKGVQIRGVQTKAAQAGARGGANSVFTTLRRGLAMLIEAMVLQIPSSWIRLSSPVTRLRHTARGWTIETASNKEEDGEFDVVLMATPVHVASELLRDTDHHAAQLMQIGSSSAIVVAFGFSTSSMELPPGFGFLVPPNSGEKDSLLAATFVDQKFNGRVPEGGRLIRAFFGGENGTRLLDASDATIATLARRQLEAVLGKLPTPVITVVRRWPRSLPQYGVGHLERMAELQERIHAIGNLSLIGNGYRGVGLPDLIRDARAAARACLNASR